MPFLKGLSLPLSPISPFIHIGSEAIWEFNQESSFPPVKRLFLSFDSRHSGRSNKQGATYTYQTIDKKRMDSTPNRL